MTLLVQGGEGVDEVLLFLVHFFVGFFFGNVGLIFHPLSFEVVELDFSGVFNTSVLLFFLFMSQSRLSEFAVFASHEISNRFTSKS